MTEPARHHCRNLRCRTKLPNPVENHHHAFCARGCHSAFYRSRCLVCEDPMRRKNDRQRFKSGHRRCINKYRQFPHAYEWGRYPPSRVADNPLTSAHYTGVKSAHFGERARAWRIVAGSEPETVAWGVEPLVISRYAAQNYPLDIINKRREERRGWSWLSVTALDPGDPAPARVRRDNDIAVLRYIDAKMGEDPQARWESSRWEIPWREWTPQERSLSSTAAGDPGPIPDFLRRA